MTNINKYIEDSIDSVWFEDTFCEGFNNITTNDTSDDEDTIYLPTTPESDIISSSDECEDAPFKEGIEKLMLSDSDDDFDEVIQNYMTPTACISTNVENTDEEIPPITIKTKIKPEKYADAQHLIITDKKVLPLLIIEILASEIITNHPPLYRIHGVQYKYTKIFGTIINIHKNSNERATIGIDDGSSCINCFVYDNKVVEKSKEVAQFLVGLCKKSVESNNKKIHEQNTVSSDEDSAEESEASFDYYLEKQAQNIGRKCNKKLENNPSIKMLNLGDQVTVVGKVVDIYERVIFAWSVRFTKDSESLINHIDARLFSRS